MLSQKQINDIVDHAAVSDLARVNWDGRDRAPIGYVKGMAVTFALCLQKLMAKDSAALAMVRYVDGPGERDVFDHYEDRIRGAGLQTEDVGVGRTISTDIDRLRILFVILTGLGMRESSGGIDIGRDESASNVTAETAEAGTWQQSWGSRRASPEIEKLFRTYQHSAVDAIFTEGVKLRPGALVDFGEGPGAGFQAMCKGSPAFAAQCAAIGLRTLYNEWGPIIRREAELRPEADALFRQVQAIMAANAPVVAEKPAAGWLSVLVGMLLAMFGRAPTKPAPAPMPGSPNTDQPIWMRWAAREVGFHETGVNHGIDRYIDLAKSGSRGALLGQPWCAVFVNAALEASGIPGSHSAMARSFERNSNFTELAGPAYGAIVTMWRGSEGSGAGHVGFYVGENDRGVVLLDGNDGDGVRVGAPKDRGRIEGYFWPKSVPLPKVGKIIFQSKDTNSSGSES